MHHLFDEAGVGEDAVLPASVHNVIFDSQSKCKRYYDIRHVAFEVIFSISNVEIVTLCNRDVGWTRTNCIPRTEFSNQ